MGWLTSRNSRVVRWAWTAFSLVVRTTMPSLTTVLQAICSFGIFSISTRHIRQLPSTGRSGCQQKWGMSIPTISPAWITVVPGGTSTTLPSIVHLGIAQLPFDAEDAEENGEDAEVRGT